MRSTSALVALLSSAALFSASGATPVGSQLTKRYHDVRLQHDNPPEDLLCPPLKFPVPIPVNGVSLSTAHWKDGNNCRRTVNVTIGSTTYPALALGECATCDTNGLGINDPFWNKVVGDETDIFSITGDWIFTD
ncbi:hypothetical protein NM688_g7167 [Phlebia brevispora]|uniref:Uncharacterized protein n=1 Tax=Phlebia brevispora TaxID=194682 RepID=A0ACC1S8M3_9APHY|nr:hypothetical protein NM688_g7167 [Phlebia brevispora]